MIEYDKIEFWIWKCTNCGHMNQELNDPEYDPMLECPQCREVFRMFQESQESEQQSVR